MRSVDALAIELWSVARTDRVGGFSMIVSKLEYDRPVAPGPPLNGEPRRR